MPHYQLHIDNRIVTTLESVTLSLEIATEAWAVARKSFFGKLIRDWLYGVEHLHAAWCLEIRVDETSGDDCAPAPGLRMPVDLAGFPARLDGLSGTARVEGADVAAEAWYGNDAPELRNNRLAFGEWLDRDHVQVIWTADYDWGRQNPAVVPFRFEGAAKFAGVRMQVKRDEDAPVFLSELFPRLDMAALDMAYGQEIVHPGKGFAEDRRRWREAVWMPKG